ncbi:MAG: DUF2254 domain-containing protein [Anaerococcus sp.]|nr:DUF2254 domain-containing protein [Anaerococcus sp.]
MVNNLRLAYANNRNFIRIVRYILISFAFLIITWLIDYRYPSLKRGIPDIFLLSADVTSSFLSNLSGTFLTVATFTFTTILTVLNKYSGSLTPRIVQDFIDKPNVLSLFGVYIGGFFYTVLALFMVQNIDSKIPLLAGTLAVFYALGAMVSFILFVRRVLRDIKFSNVIESVYDNAHGLVLKEADRRRESSRFDLKSYEDEIKIYANATGFLYDIDHKNLIDSLSDIKSQLVIEKKIGEYVARGMYIAKLYVYDKMDFEGEDKEEFLEKLSASLLINVSKNDFEDYHHELTNLVEISMMALSPGVNDPNTAIEAIRKISSLLGDLFSSKNSYVLLNENDNSKIIYKSYTVKEELYNSFAQIIHYGKEDPMVARAILNGLYLVYMLAEESVKSEVREFMDYTYEICKNSVSYQMDKDGIEIIYKDFCKNRDNQVDQEAAREEE